MTPDDRCRLIALLARIVGHPVEIAAMAPLTGGASSETWSLDALRPEPWPLIVQRAATAEPQKAGFTRANQARLQALAGAYGVPVAGIVAIFTPEDGLGDGFIMDRLPGEALAPRWLKGEDFAAARAALTCQCAKVLARLHAIPLEAANGLGLAGGDASEQWQAMDSNYRRFGINLPVFELALAWLGERCGNAPASSIVHGDFRSGNLLIGPNGLVAALDWELAHLGDGAEDLGWLCVNAWRFGHWQRPVGGFGEREELYRAYTEAGGKTIDRDRAHMWEVWGTLRWGLACLQLGDDHASGRLRSVERAAIGRRVSEVELDLLHLIRHGSI
ncbi:MAG: phosphotransferase family protein [Polymorphobacter sp.]|uniref:phosphotransferase family protein n=1 Tax=Polymorphobacter sp. TaxID=1909290 RepID=UPI003A8C0677